ncbi:MAG: PfkB family carbohydrate kinase [Candidatus Sigynarchaeota archaeon]
MMAQEKENWQVVDFSTSTMELDGLLSGVKNNLPRWVASVKAKRVFFGFDGVLDQIYTVVARRYSVDDYVRLTSIGEWADIVKNAAGSAANFEIIEKKRSTGGFVANTAGALLALAAPLDDVTLVGGFGVGGIAPPFKDLFETKFKCKLISIGEPGYTHAYEFDDGKLMMTSFASILTLDAATIMRAISEQELVNMLNGTSLFGLGYWSVTPGMTGIFKLFATNVFPALQRPLDLFLDLASLRKRSEGDIRDMAAIINQFPDHIRVTLSLNDKEAMQLHEALSRKTVVDDFPSADISLDNKDLFVFLGEKISQQLPRCHVIIHTPKFAVSISLDKVFIVPNAYTKHASYTVAAGDAFNGGIALGLLAGCTPQEILAIGNATTSYFIRTGVRCNKEQCIELLGHYKQYLQADHPEIIHDC